MTAPRFIELASKKLSRSITAAELVEFELLLQDPALALRFQQLKKFWDEGTTMQAPDTDGAWATLMQEIGTEEELPVRRTRKWLVPSIAAVLLIAIAVWAFNFYSGNNASSALASAGTAVQNGAVEKQNGKGVRSMIVLADGSKVWLNADSRLSYPKTFAGDNREVQLSGEAFFDVVRNPKKPFIIQLATGTIKVLGTSFNVKAYPGEQAVETSVVTGKVAFIPAKKGDDPVDTILLTPNEKAVQVLRTGRVSTVPTLSKEDKAWIEGKLIFRDAGMREITTELERYFGKDVVVLDEAIYDYHLTGSFQNDTVEEILYYLSKTKPFTYKVTETQIILSLVK